MSYSMTVRAGAKGISEAIAAIDESAWIDIDYPEGGAAQVAEADYRGRRLIVRRTRLTTPAQARLWPDWRHHAFLTDLEGPAVEVDAFHRAHATVELAIRDAKEGSGLEHMPSGVFAANGAWLACVVLAHNLIRWTALAGGVVEDHLMVSRSLRTRLIAVPARLVNPGRDPHPADARALAVGRDLLCRPGPTASPTRLRPGVVEPPRLAHRRGGPALTTHHRSTLVQRGQVAVENNSTAPPA